MFNSIPSPCVPLVGISLGISFSEEPVQRSSSSARNPHTWGNEDLSKKYYEKLGEARYLNPCLLDGQGRQWPNFQMIPQL